MYKSFYLITMISLLSCHTLSATDKSEYDIECHTIEYPGIQHNRSQVHVTEYSATDIVPEKTMIFLHGGPGIQNQDQYEPLVNQFTTNGFKVLIPEVEGSAYYALGKTAVNDYKSRPNYFNEIDSILNHVDNNFHIIAHSLGAHQFMRYYVENPNAKKPATMTLIAGVTNIGAARFAITLDRSMGSLRRESVEDAVETLNGVINMLWNHWVHGTAYNDCETTYSKENNEKFSLYYNIGKLNLFVPTHIMHAEDDPQVPFVNSLELAKAMQDKGITVKFTGTSLGEHSFIKKESSNEELQTKLLKEIYNFTQKPISNFPYEYKIGTDCIYLELVEEFEKYSQDPTRFVEYFKEKIKTVTIEQ